MRSAGTLARYVARRLALAVPTLLGIVVVTFGLVHLAPGSPLDAGQGAASSGGGRGADQAVRRLYFLDLPIFFNPQPRGLAARVERLVAGLKKAAPGSSEEIDALADVRQCGTACLPLLASIAGSKAWSLASPHGRALAAIRADHPKLGTEEAGLGRWLAALLPQLSEENLSRLAMRLGSDPTAEIHLAALGTAALPAVMPLLLEGNAAALRVATQITGRQEGWDEWWYVSRRDHVAFSTGQQLVGHLTETRFAKWLGRLLTLRLGHSTRDGQLVSTKLATALPLTLLLSGISLFLAYLLAVPLGVLGAVRRGSLFERASTLALFLLYSLPAFWGAMLLILLFGGVGLLDWFPIHGLSSDGLEEATGLTWLLDRAHHLVLPVACLTYGSLAVIARHQRAAMLEVLGQDFVRTARAKGLPERAVILRHALPNALIPSITLLGLQLPYLLGGSVIIERIFNLPGMGLLTFQAFLHRDYPVIMAVSLLAAAVTLIGLLLCDICYAVADPRISLEGERR